MDHQPESAVSDARVIKKESPVSRRKRQAAAGRSSGQTAARDLICGAALKLFAEGGFNAVSMRTIAQELGVSAMMPYSYFPSKDHLLLELRTRAFQRMGDSLRLARDEGENPRDAFEALCLAYLDFAADEPGAYRLMFDFWAHESDAVVESEFRAASLRQSASFHEIEAAVAALSGSGDPAADAALVWASLHGLASLALTRQLRRGQDMPRIAPAMIEMLVTQVSNRRDIAGGA